MDLAKHNQVAQFRGNIWMVAELRHLWENAAQHRSREKQNAEKLTARLFSDHVPDFAQSGRANSSGVSN
jgi:hypothetical protein